MNRDDVILGGSGAGASFTGVTVGKGKVFKQGLVVGVGLS
jgi:hypothetical protein